MQFLHVAICNFCTVDMQFLHRRIEIFAMQVCQNE